jgi:hypothetical protein
MNNPSSSTQPTDPNQMETPSNEPKPTYVKLALRNMVRKKGTSLKHFFLTTAGLLGFLIGISYLTR